jgi:co-chaperonin GroES (HSP10)
LAKYSGTEVEIEGEQHLIVDADDILGMMES